jgi:hypothetical protein
MFSTYSPQSLYYHWTVICAKNLNICLMRKSRHTCNIERVMEILSYPTVTLSAWSVFTQTSHTPLHNFCVFVGFEPSMLFIFLWFIWKQNAYSEKIVSSKVTCSRRDFAEKIALLAINNNHSLAQIFRRISFLFLRVMAVPTWVSDCWLLNDLSTEFVNNGTTWYVHLYFYTYVYDLLRNKEYIYIIVFVPSMHICSVSIVKFTSRQPHDD